MNSNSIDGFSMDELAYYTNEELVNELVKRNSFLGIIIQSKDEVKQRTEWDEKTFVVISNPNNITRNDVHAIINQVNEHYTLIPDKGDDDYGLQEN